MLLVGFWEVFINQANERFSNVNFHVLAEGRVKPHGVSRSVFMSFVLHACAMDDIL